MFEQRYTQNADGMKLCYYVAGHGPRTLVVANGHGATHHVWEDVVDYLKDDFTIILWDYRGQHGSDAPQVLDAIRIEDHAGDCEAIMDAEAIESCVLAGWSLGVQVALQTFRRRPQAIEALALIHGAHDELLHRLFGGRFNPVIRTVIDSAQGLLPHLQPFIVPLIQKTLNSPLGFRPLQSIGFVSTVTPGLKQMAIELVSLDMRSYMRTVTLAGEHQCESWLGEVNIPVAVTGGRADWLTPEPQILRAFERLPNATYHQFEGTHFPLVEEPNRLAELIQKLAHYAQTP